MGILCYDDDDDDADYCGSDCDSDEEGRSFTIIYTPRESMSRMTPKQVANPLNPRRPHTLNPLTP